MAHFPSVKQAGYLTGEASPSYLNHPEAFNRLKAVNPETKLIILLRNPVARAISHYYHWLRLGWDNRSLELAIALEREQLEINPNYWHSEKNYLAGGVYVATPREHLTYNLGYPREIGIANLSPRVRLYRRIFRVPLRWSCGHSQTGTDRYKIKSVIITKTAEKKWPILFRCQKLEREFKLY